MKKIKQTTAMLLALLIAIGTMAVNASAATLTGKLTRDHYIPGYYFNFKNAGMRCGGHYGQPSVWKVGSRYTYCIECGVNITGWTGTLTAKDTYSHLSEANKERLNLAMTYGYNGTTHYGHSLNAEYYATQILCWIISENAYGNTTKENKIIAGALNKCSETSAVKDSISKMKTQIDRHSTKPSFLKDTTAKATTYNLTYDDGYYTKTLTDSNNILEEYEFKTSNSAVTYSVSGKKITFKTKNKALSTVTVTATRVKSKYLTKSKYAAKKAYYITDGVNNGKSGKQDIVTYNSGEAVIGYTKLQVAVGDLKIKKSSTDGIISGVKFTVKGPSGWGTKNVKTGSDGTYTLSDVPIGKYTVTETIDTTKYLSNSGNKAQSKTIAIGETATFSFTNAEKSRGLKIIKTADDGVLEGWVFNIKGTDVLGKSVNLTRTTDSNGIILISASGSDSFRPSKKGTTYTVSELGRYVDGVLKTPMECGYSHNPKSQSKKVEYGATTPYYFHNPKQDNFTLYKTSDDGVVEGVRFAIDDGVSEFPKIVTTDADGKIKLDVVEEIELGKENEQIKPGTYTVTEISTPKFADLNSDICYFVKNEPQTITIEKGVENTLYFENKYITKNITVKKTSDDGVVEGFDFRLTGTDVDGNEVDLTATTDENGDLEFGEVIIGDYHIEEINVPGEYEIPSKMDITFSEFKAAENSGETFILKSITNRTKKANFEWKKVDSESKQAIAGAEFDILQWSEEEQQYLPAEQYIENNGVWEKIEAKVTYNEETKTYFAEALYSKDNLGKYKIVETKAPDGYVLDKNNCEWEVTYEQSGYISDGTIVNTPQKGRIGIYKVDEDYNFDGDATTPAEGTQTNLLAGAVFNIYAKEDIEVGGDIKYKADELVDTITTTAEDIVYSKYLYLGTYNVVETKAPDGCVLDDTPQEVTLEYQGQDTDLFDTALTFVNKFQKGTIVITKVDSKDKDTKLKGAEFTIYANKDIVVNGKTKYKQGAEIDVITTDKKGIAKSKLLYLGEYKIVETKAPDSYIINETPHIVVLKYQGENVSVFDESLTITNKKKDNGTITPEYNEDGGGDEDTSYDYPTSPVTGESEINNILIYVFVVAIFGVVISFYFLNKEKLKRKLSKNKGF